MFFKVKARFVYKKRGITDIIEPFLAFALPFMANIQGSK